MPLSAEDHAEIIILKARVKAGKQSHGVFSRRCLVHNGDLWALRLAALEFLCEHPESNYAETIRQAVQNTLGPPKEGT